MSSRRPPREHGKPPDVSHVPMLRPGQFGYPLRKGQMLYHGGKFEIRHLKNGAFLSPFTRIARQYVGKTARWFAPTQAEGVINRFIVQRLPRLIVQEKVWHVDALSYHLWRTVNARLGPDASKRERALEMSRVKPSFCDGWYMPGFEVVLWRPHEWVAFWGSKLARFDASKETFWSNRYLKYEPGADEPV